MSAALIIYFADMARPLALISGIGFLFSAVATCICIFIYSACKESTYESNKETARAAKNISNYSWPMMTVCLLCTLLFPSKEAIYMMAGAKLSQDIATSPAAKELGSKVLTLINQKLDNEIKPIKGETK